VQGSEKTEERNKYSRKRGQESDKKGKGKYGEMLDRGKGGYILDRRIPMVFSICIC
jgi:hypothetical protein